MSVELRCTEAAWQELVDALLPGDGAEHAALLVVGRYEAGTTTLVLVRDVVPLHGDDLLGSGRDHLRIAPVAVARNLKRAVRDGCSLVVCHSHPFGGPVAASSIDLETEAELCGRVVAERTGLGAGALILGPGGFDGRWWVHGMSHNIDTVRTVGARIDVQQGAAPPRTWSDASVDRQVRAWGAAGQARLGRAHVVVVGVGGTGSHVVTQLAHLGVGHMTLVDDDEVDESNLSRLVGCTPRDIGRRKVDVISEHVQRIRPGLDVARVPRSVLDVDPRPLALADVVVCATDGHGSRALLTELAAQYLVPVVDLGVEVQPDASGARAGGGVRVLRPGEWCLHCAGTLDAGLVREEYLPDDDRALEERRGYLRGVREPAPSVISLNGVVASLAVLEVCQLLCDFLPAATGRLLYRAHDRALTTAAVTRHPACHVCGSRGLLGLGDARPLPLRVPAAERGILYDEGCADRAS